VLDLVPELVLAAIKATMALPNFEGAFRNFF
jgi:hypothetical protein